MAKKPIKRSTSRGYLPRRVEERPLIPRFLIVCEGEKTEKHYFEGFRVPTRPVVINVQGIGEHTVQLVRKAIELQRKHEYDQVWCVLDRDSFPAERFNEALQLAASKGIQVAYSNEAFELWYLLHFHFFNTAMSRANYGEKLGELLGHRYEKNSKTMYAKLESRQVEAIGNAARLLAAYTPCKPAEDNPSTTVHLLVEELRKFAR
jgi:hypothetical protein